jgi:nicotinate-nucleotide pyrophosphorylase (carboxylating)
VSTWLQPEPQNWRRIVDAAFAEDVGDGDITSVAVPPTTLAQWRIEAQAEGVVCGVGIAEYLLSPIAGDPADSFLEVHVTDGDRVEPGTIVMNGIIPARRALTAERTALNFLMHLSGIATLTDKFVQKVEGTGARVIDTRKTLPLLRSLQKYAVRCGGGRNHRTGLYDGAMIKDNHIQAAGSIRDAVQGLRSQISHMTKIEVECETLEQVAEAVEANADVILLDNMDPSMMRQAVTAFKGRCLFEASGGINLNTVRAAAESGVDVVSVGALTHSAPGLALHMEIE